MGIVENSNSEIDHLTRQVYFSGISQKIVHRQFRPEAKAVKKALIASEFCLKNALAPIHDVDRL
jgi:hypothetical protein